MSKKLNIIEAMKMPIGTEFKMIRNGADMPDNVYIDIDTCFRYKRNDNPFPPYADNILSIFIPIQQPVSFMEVANSNKKCRVEHELVNEHFRENYHEFDYLMSEISTFRSDYQLKKIINEGKWYLEE